MRSLVVQSRFHISPGLGNIAQSSNGPLEQHILDDILLHGDTRFARENENGIDYCHEFAVPGGFVWVLVGGDGRREPIQRRYNIVEGERWLRIVVV